MNPNLNVTRIIFNRNDVGSALATKLTIQKINASNLAKQETSIRFPQLASSTVTKVMRYGDYHILTMGYNFTCAVKFSNYTFQVYKPINASYEFFQFNNTMYPLSWDLYQPLTNWNDPKYLACLSAANNKIPELTSLTVFDAQTA